MTWVLFAIVPLIIYAYWAMKALNVLRQQAHTHSNGWRHKDEWPPFTLIMAFRNEREHLSVWGKALEEWLLAFPSMQVVLVDDGSTDGSADALGHLENYSNYRLLTTVGVGKKLAIQRAVEESKGEVLLFTDADVLPKKEWIAAMLQPFANSAIQMVLGPVVYGKAPTLKNRMMTLDFLALMISSEAAVLLQRPVMANGANYAVRRTTRMRASQKDLQIDLPSGDDVFLLHYISQKHGPNTIEFVRDLRACVETSPPDNWHAFVKQRLRWGSKSRSYRDRDALGLTLLVFLTNVSLPILFLFDWKMGLLAWLVKALLDYPLLRKAVTHFGRGDALSVFLFQSIIYPIYITLLGLASQLWPVKWKN